MLSLKYFYGNCKKNKSTSGNSKKSKTSEYVFDEKFFLTWLQIAKILSNFRPNQRQKSIFLKIGALSFADPKVLKNNPW